MSKQQLYINGNVVDMPNEAVKIKVESNLFSDASKLMTAHSYNIALPRTINNDAIFGNAYVPAADTGGNTTHRYLSASLFMDGVPLFEGGKAVLNEVDDDGYNLNLYWGIIDMFDEIKREGLQLCDLADSAYWDDATMATWSTLAKTYASTELVYNGGMDSEIYDQLDTASKEEADVKPWTLPVVSARSIMHKISTLYSLNFDYSTEFSSRLSELFIPLTTLRTKTKDEVLTFEEGSTYIIVSSKKYLALSIPTNANNGRFLQNAVEVTTNSMGEVQIYPRTKINVKSIKITNAK